MNTANARTIVLTGASGFVGRQILRELTSRGQKVRVLVRDQARLGPGYKSTLVEVFEIPDLFAAAPERLDAVLSEVDLLIHAAWYAEPGQYLTSPINLHCLEGTLRLVEAFCRTGVIPPFLTAV
jgi:nucleoside-diphosphate-sugar epimerase